MWSQFDGSGAAGQRVLEVCSIQYYSPTCDGLEGLPGLDAPVHSYGDDSASDIRCPKRSCGVKVGHSRPPPRNAIGALCDGCGGPCPALSIRYVNAAVEIAHISLSNSMGEPNFPAGRDVQSLNRQLNGARPMLDGGFRIIK